MSLRAKLLLPLALIGILIAGYLYAFWIPRTLAADEVAHLKGVDQHLNSVADTLIPLMLGNQLDILYGNLNSLKHDNANWLDIRLVNAENKQLYPLATAAPQAPATLPDARKVERPIRYLGERLGTLIIQVDLAPSLANTRKEIGELTFLLLGMLAALMLTIVTTAEIMVGRPVRQLSNAASRLARMEFDTPLPKAGQDEIGELVKSFSSMRDDLQGNHASLLLEIAERKEAEEALRQLNETLEQRVRSEVAANRDKDHLLIQQSRLAAMGEMVHNIAHQWRQPLNSLSLLISNIVDDFRFKTLTEETLVHDAASARRLLEKMSTTIDDFRDFFRPDREKTSFDVAAAVRDAVFIVEAALKSNRIEIALDAPPGLTATGFPSQYGQAVLNLLVNAKEAIQEHRKSGGSIRVALKNEAGHAVLSVEDNGGGIPEDILPRLFDPYFTTKDQGSGIGLYMAKMIIERNMDGMIAAANIENGARFVLSIPMEIPS
ncbi:MAG: HAMP domain-containing histidine kinase [Nitrosomonadales bacterium]|nr:HAMP domain-containing histidine kinase [Nitrosomonadales bacterium]